MGQNVGQIALEIVGTAVGSIWGQPQLGFAAGALLGGALFPTKIDGPHVKNLQAMNASYGTMLPFGYGNFRVAATLIDQIPIQEAGSSSGKGGPSVTTYSYYGWFAVALCEGPITDIRRLWANGILIYDVSDTATPATILASNQFRAKYLTVYKGDYTQGPDPTLQSWPQNGVGNTPAYRGSAYVVFRGMPLANFGNVEPSISAEIVTVTATLAITKIWENAATGFFFGSGSNESYLTGFSGGACRAIKKTMTFYNSFTGTYQISLADGSSLNNDNPTGYENSISSGPLFLDPANQHMGMVMIQSSGQSGVYSHSFGDTTGGNVIGHASNTTAASLYVCDTQSFAILGDIIPQLTLPSGVTGTWRIVAAFPCAEWNHLAVITKDSGGTGNYWLHVVTINSNGPGSEVAYYQFSSPTLGANASYADVPGAWVDPYFDRGNSAMMESTLNTFWSGSAPGVIRYYGISAGQVVELANLTYSALVGVGWGSIYADNGVFVYMSDNYAHCLTVGQTGTALSTVPLSSIVNDICRREGIAAGNIDTTALTDAVWGFVVDRQMTGRAALEALMPAWWFDGVESDTKVKFVKRSATPVTTITLDDMGAEVNGKVSAQPLVFTRGSEIELPTQINLTYYALASQYQQGMQYARRISTSQQNNIQSIDSAAVMDDNGAAVAAAIVLWDAIAGRTTFRFSTSYKWAQLEPTDSIYLNSGAELYLVRLNRKTEAAGKIDWEVVGCAPVYSQSVSGGAITSVQPVSGQVATTAVIMDIPPLRDQDGAGANLYVAMYGPIGWPGATLFKSSDSGITWVAGVSQGAASTVGKSTTALGDWLGNNMFDEGNTVNVQLLSASTLASLPELSVLNGGNVGLLGNEIFQFKNAVLVSGTTYKLSGLLRGRFGTGWAAIGHGIGETFVLLSPPGVIQIQPIPTADIGQPRLYQAVSAGQAVGSGAQQTITAKANTLVCFSPVLLNAGGAGYYNDIILTWTRRNRIHWQWLESVDEPMNEATESYLVSIFSGASVVRTFTVSAPTVTYTLAQQITDFGGSGLTAITFGVQQMSAVTGPGVMAKATITLPPIPYIPITYTKALSATQASTATLATSKIISKALSATQSTTATLSTTYIPGGGPAGTYLLHFDDGNGSTAFTDVYSHTFSAFGPGGIAESTTQSQFGGCSLHVPGAANAGTTNCITTPDATDLRFGSGDFTIEFWIYIPVVNPFVYRGIMGKCGSGAQGSAPSNAKGSFMFFNDINTSQMRVRSSVSGTAWDVDINGAMGVGAWHAVAYTRGGTTFTLWIDGTSVGTATASGALTEDTTALAIGADNTGDSGSNLDGYIDEVRITKGTCRYTANYTPTGPFTS